MEIERRDEAWFEETSAIMIEAAKKEISPSEFQEQSLSFAMSMMTDDDGNESMTRDELKKLYRKLYGWEFKPLPKT